MLLEKVHNSELRPQASFIDRMPVVLKIRPNTMSDTITLYHNPRCSKSRAALALLQEHGVEPQVVRYLETPLTLKALQQLNKALAVAPRDMLRTNEDAYKSLNLAAETSGTALLQAIVQHPKLLQRPIAVKGGRAVIGRPPETVLELLE